ncbi:MAG: hypothetical protein LBT14_03330 [Treponema sp.]|jgi:hydroxymethylpyrimidine pyrophosphatase-like HAD family hydrolase|nr:hypothetical protein [Treponema sp.]
MPDTKFKPGDPRIHREGRPKKKTFQDILIEMGAVIKDKEGNEIDRLDGDERLLQQIVDIGIKEKNPAMMKFIYQHIHAPQADEEILALKKRTETARAKKIEIDNAVRKDRAELRKKLEDAEAKIKQYKAEQEELKTRKMTGEYIDVALMRYYFSFFQRGISDSFASIKKISPDLKRLYVVGKEKDAEKFFITELGICFSNAVKGLEEEIGKDMRE